MKINKLIASALMAMTIVGLSGCNKFLDKTPLDANSDATNWTSEASLQTYSWSLYGDFDSFAYGSGWTRGRYHSDVLCDDYTADSFNEFTKNVPTASGSWTTPYERIRKANVLLARVDKVPNLSAEAANHWKGVARFFRALHHFELLKTYGDVVWIDEEIQDINSDEARLKSRDSRVTVADNIVADLKFAVENLRTPANAGANTVNKYVADALLARVGVFEGAWEKYHQTAGGHPEVFYTAAKNAANEIISSGLYDIVDGGYRASFNTLDLSKSKEVLLYRAYTVANVNGGKVGSAHSMQGWSNSSTPTWGLTKSAVENYAQLNGLPIDNTYDDQTFEGVFANRDKRMAATIYDVAPYATGFAGDRGIVSTTGFWTYKFVSIETRDAMKNNGTWDAPSNDSDAPIFSYAEVLENYAEACAELGACSQADLDKSVNILRARHGGMPALTLTGTDGCSVNGTPIALTPYYQNMEKVSSVLIQEIRRDRRSELMAEGFRYLDVKRWKLGKLLDLAENIDANKGISKAAYKAYLLAHGVTEADWNGDHNEKNPGIEWSNFWTSDGYKASYFTNDVDANPTQTGSRVSRTWNDKYYLEPIPSGQITLDKNLGQNPGW